VYTATGLEGKGRQRASHYIELARRGFTKLTGRLTGSVREKSGGRMEWLTTGAMQPPRSTSPDWPSATDPAEPVPQRPETPREPVYPYLIPNDTTLTRTRFADPPPQHHIALRSCHANPTPITQHAAAAANKAPFYSNRCRAVHHAAAAVHVR
jgi:hypothetical protein